MNHEDRLSRRRSAFLKINIVRVGNLEPAGSIGFDVREKLPAGGPRSRLRMGE